MTEEALRQLSKEQLIMLVLQQQEMLHGLRKQNEEATKGNQALLQRVKELEAKVEALNQPAKRQRIRRCRRQRVGKRMDPRRGGVSGRAGMRG